MAPSASDDASDREREELLDQHVAYFLQQNPEVHAKHRVRKIRPSVYNVDGREVNVEWHYSDDPAQKGYLLAIDGPLRQPFSEYMTGSEVNAKYDDQRLPRSALQQVAKGKRISFGDEHNMYSRLEAMKVAKEQALVREQAAGYARDGMIVPEQELMNKYNKVLGQKLGRNRQKAPAPTPAPAASPSPAAAAASDAWSLPPPAAAAPAATAAPAAAAAPPAAAKSPKRASPSKPKQQLTHGAPVYCAKHDQTEKRKKTKPRKEACRSCGTLIQTNYVEFALCPACSERDSMCMCCGEPVSLAARAATAPEGQAFDPDNNIFTSLGLPNLSTPQNILAPLGLRNSTLQPQTVKQAAPFASYNAYSTQNVMASENVAPMYNPMASQNVFASKNGHRMRP